MCDTSEREAEEKVQQKDQLKREMVRQVMEGDRSKVTKSVFCIHVALSWFTGWSGFCRPWRTSLNQNHCWC